MRKILYEAFLKDLNYNVTVLGPFLYYRSSKSEQVILYSKL